MNQICYLGNYVLLKADYSLWWWVCLVDPTGCD